MERNMSAERGNNHYARKTAHSDDTTEYQKIYIVGYEVGLLSAVWRKQMGEKRGDISWIWSLSPSLELSQKMSFLPTPISPSPFNDPCLSWSFARIRSICMRLWGYPIESVVGSCFLAKAHGINQVVTLLWPELTETFQGLTTKLSFSQREWLF